MNPGRRCCPSFMFFVDKEVKNPGRRYCVCPFVVVVVVVIAGFFFAVVDNDAERFFSFVFFFLVVYDTGMKKGEEGNKDGAQHMILLREVKKE